MYCPFCGQRVDATWSFCRHCGRDQRLGSDGATESAGQQLGKPDPTGGTAAEIKEADDPEIQERDEKSAGPDAPSPRQPRGAKEDHAASVPAASSCAESSVVLYEPPELPRAIEALCHFAVAAFAGSFLTAVISYEGEAESAGILAGAIVGGVWLALIFGLSGLSRFSYLVARILLGISLVFGIIGVLVNATFLIAASVSCIRWAGENSTDPAQTIGLPSLAAVAVLLLIGGYTVTMAFKSLRYLTSRQVPCYFGAECPHCGYSWAIKKLRSQPTGYRCRRCNQEWKVLPDSPPRVTSVNAGITTDVLAEAPPGAWKCLCGNQNEANVGRCTVCRRAPNAIH